MFESESVMRACWLQAYPWRCRKPQFLHFLYNFQPHRNTSLTIVASDYLENINRRIVMRRLTNAVNKQKKKIKNEKT
jgi:hypothetical protein